MMPEKIVIDSEERNARREQNKAYYYSTRFCPMMNHRGFRRGKMHTLMSPTGSGKSTFVRTVISDFIRHNKDSKVFLWLTEEHKDDFKDSIADIDLTHEQLSNITFISEMDSEANSSEIKKIIEQSVEYYQIDLFIIDNITTSKLYRQKNANEQSEIAQWIKLLSKDRFATLVISHTGSDASESSIRLLNENDIKGSKDIVLISEFVYILQPFFIGNKMFQFINCRKSRNQKLESKFIGLKYNRETNTFDNGQYVSFEELKQIFKQRNTL